MEKHLGKGITSGGPSSKAKKIAIDGGLQTPRMRVEEVEGNQPGWGESSIGAISTSYRLGATAQRKRVAQEETFIAGSLRSSEPAIDKKENRAPAEPRP